MIECCRRVQFCSGHRVLNHESKCANMHGHNYVAMFHAVSEQLDSIGRVIDFSVLKERLGGWIDERWDHTFIVNHEDWEVMQALEAVSRKKPYFIAEWNPTAENMASYLLHTVAPRVLSGTGITVRKVQLWETENCFVEVSL
jgi:6-pyruvoyltetrahydropterin/6-carboxytetrahydropterin synthase